MKNIQKLKASIIHLLGRLRFHRDEITDNELHDNGSTQVLCHSIHVQLVVEESSLLFGAFDSCKLATAGGVPDSYLGILVQVVGGAHGDRDSCLDHNQVDELWVRFHLKVTFLRN